jgi:hypothetical protein
MLLEPLVLETWAPFPSPDQFVPPTTNNLNIRTPLLPETGRRVLLSGGPNQYTSLCLLCQLSGSDTRSIEIYLPTAENPDNTSVCTTTT